MKARIPIVPTLVVLLAALLMVRLGIWQLHRLHEKEALAARYAANAGAPPVALPALLPLAAPAYYRRAGAMCLSVVRWSAQAGRDASGASGWRHVAACGSGAEGPGFAADMGVSATSDAPRGWTGGMVRGRVVPAGGASLAARLLGMVGPATPMIVSETAAPGLRPSAQPDPATEPDNHLSYAVQWFLFAGVAVAIYVIVLRRRGRAGEERE